VRRLDRYIVGNVLNAMLMVLVVVLSLDLLFAFIAETDEFKNNYQVMEALRYVLTTIPRRIYDYLPLAAFIGCLIGLGMLANSSELTVMRAAGVSVSRIVWSTMKPALIFVFLGVLIGEYVAPNAERIAQTQRALDQGAAETVVAKTGVWHREGNVFMHFNAVETQGVLHGISLFTFDENGRLRSSAFARQATFADGQWTLQDIVETELLEQQSLINQVDSRPWNTGLSPDVLSVLILKPEYLSIEGLYTYVNYLSEQGLNANVYLMAFWKKVLQPLATGVLVLVAISFIFGPLRSVTMGFRVFCGIIVGLVFKYLQDLLGPASLVFGFDPIMATLVPVLVGGAIGTLLLSRVR